MAGYFKNVSSLEQLRKQYRDLLKKFHPDNVNGSTEACQEINAEYDQLFRILKDRHESRADDNSANAGAKQSDYNRNMYDWENDKALREALHKIIGFDGIEILICGQWIWVAGNTYSYRKELKEIGFKWASTKKQWYFHTENFRKKSHKTLSMDEIKSYYGSTRIQTDSKILLEA